MGTYDPKQILSDYANGNITVEMAIGHALQHLDKLYELQTVANLNRYDLRGRVDTLENRLNSLQTKIDRLMAGMENSPPRSSG